MEGAKGKKISRENFENNTIDEGLKTMSSYDKMDINTLDNRTGSLQARRSENILDNERNDYDDAIRGELHSNSMFLKGSKGINGYMDERLSRSLDQNDQNLFNNSLLEQPRYPKLSILKGGKMPRQSVRIDRNGTVIHRNDKSYKISFADRINNDKARLADVYMVESYKRFNAENTHGQQQGCCTII